MLECPDESRIWMNEFCVDVLGLVGVGLVALANVSSISSIAALVSAWYQRSPAPCG